MRKQGTGGADTAFLPVRMGQLVSLSELTQQFPQHWAGVASALADRELYPLRTQTVGITHIRVLLALHTKAEDGIYIHLLHLLRGCLLGAIEGAGGRDREEDLGELLLGGLLEVPQCGGNCGHSSKGLRAPERFVAPANRACKIDTDSGEAQPTNTAICRKLTP